MIGSPPVECWEESPYRVRFSRRGNATAQRKFRCRWADAMPLVTALRGTPEIVGSVLVYSNAPHPDFPGLLPDDFDIEGEGVLSVGPNGALAYQWAVITARYSSLDFGDADEQGFVGVDVATNVITLPKSASILETVDCEGVPPQDSPGLPVGVIGFTRVIRNFPNLPIDKLIAAAENPINDQPMFAAVAAGGVAAPGTVIFEGGRASRRIYANNASANGTSGVWDMELKFTARPKIPWDFLPLFIDGAYVLKQVRFTDGSAYVGRSDLNQLFIATT